MKVFVWVLLALFVTSIALDVDARRLSAGKNIGKQREMAAPQPANAPAPQQAAPTQQQVTTGGAPAQPAPTGNRWLGPLAGLAMGAGLAALFLNNGVPGLLAGLAMIGLILAAAVYAARMMRARAGGEPMTVPAGPVGSLHGLGGTGTPSQAPFAATPPADFDAAEFVRHARRNFVRLQAVHDKGDLETLRDFVTPELFRDIAAQVEHGDGRQQTEVVTLTADVVGVATEGDHHVVSVRFAGLIREAPLQETTPFSEVWHLEKPVDGSSGWLVSGIQQDEPGDPARHV